MGIYIDDSEVVFSFIANEISLGDYHGLFRGIARDIGLSERIVRMRVIDGEFELIKQIIEGDIKWK